MRCLQAAVLLAIAGLGGCNPSGARFQPTPATVRSYDPGAKGYVVLGFADENAARQVFRALQTFSVLLRQENGQVGSMAMHDGCGTPPGLARGGNCEDDGKLDYRVLEVMPGTWAVSGVIEAMREGFPSQTIRVAGNLPPGLTFKVNPGQVVYIGDFLFTVDTETQAVFLKRYTRDDDAAARALAAYPGLAGQIDYIDVTPKP